MCLSIAVHDPSKVLSCGQFQGFEWMVTHNGIGYRCGYVRVPAGHPWHGRDYNDVRNWEGEELHVHGGLTFSEADMDCGNGGEDSAWWLGFDCAHSGDARDPSLLASEVTRQFLGGLGGPSETIRSTEYVERECRELCIQAGLIACQPPVSVSETPPA